MIFIKWIYLILGLIWLFCSSVLGAVYYVNDSSTNGDVYCFAAGDDSYSGEYPENPMLTVTNLLAQKDLAPGDTVYIDTGNYSNFAVRITSDDSGSSDAPVAFIGSTSVMIRTVFYVRSGSTGWLLEDDAQWIIFENMEIVGGGAGIRVREGCNNNAFSKILVKKTVGTPTMSGNLAGISIYRAKNVTFTQCALVDNVCGFYQRYSSGLKWVNGIAYRNISCAFDNPAGIEFKNSVFGRGVVFAGSEPSGSSHNNIFWDATFHENGKCGTVAEFESSYSWSNTLYANPEFADPLSYDFHPKSLVGRYDAMSGMWVTDTVQSVLIDFGIKADDWAEEPGSNGGRINAGIYGNTPWASKSLSNTWIRAMTFNDGGALTGAVNVLQWDGGLLEDTFINVQYSLDLGNDWMNIASDIPATNNVFIWDVTGLPSTSAFWRVVSASDVHLFDMSDQRFSVNGGRICYYVNDGSTSNDVYCLRVGEDSNSGISPHAPKRSIASILNSYSLFGSSEVLIDSGTYDEHSIEITGDDGGSLMGGYCKYKGGATGKSAFTVNAAYDCFILDDYASCVELSAMSIYGGRCAVRQENGRNLILRECDIRHTWGRPTSQNTAAVVVLGEGNNFVNGCVFADNKTALYNNKSSVQLGNITFWNNESAMWQVSGRLRNSTIVGGTAFVGGSVSDDSDYNLFWQTDYSAESLREFQEQRGGWWHCTVAEPGFVDADGGDFHLKSEAGRYDGDRGEWVTDGQTSILVDFGGVDDDYTNEPEPNGGRVNAGAYGNTVWASKSPDEMRLNVLSFNDGGTLDVPGGKVYWNAAGGDSSATVRIELSLNGGSDWVTAADGVAASAGEYAWVYTNELYSSESAKWRVVLESDTNVVSECSDLFYFHYGAAKYYVNDGSTVGDVYTEAVGNDANSGITGKDPKASLQSLLNSKSIRAGDIIYVDTGRYNVTSNNVFTALDSGDSNDYVHVVGSSSSLNGGSVFVRSSEASGTYGLGFDGASYIAVDGIHTEGGRDGFVASGSDHILLDRVSAKGALSSGISSASSGVTVENAVLWQNDATGLRVSSGVVSLSNSVVVASGGDTACLSLSTTSVLRADFNDYWCESNAVVATLDKPERSINALATWVTLSGLDMHSMNSDPLFVDPDNGDFHLQSSVQSGRYDPAIGWVTDDVSSPLIDTGDAAQSCALEPEPNGNRINMGLFGNTSQASLSRTNGWLTLAYPNDGGAFDQTGFVHWVAGGTTADHAVDVSISLDGGATWQSVSNNVVAGTEVVSFDTSGLGETPAAKIKVSSAELSAESETYFSLRNGGLSLYVNDASQSGDVYTSAAGSSNNVQARMDAPLDSLGRALAWYDLEPGDTVYVDTGIYTNESSCRLARADSGSPASLVKIIGTTNTWLGSRLQHGLVMEYADDVDLSGISISGGTKGLVATGTKDITLRGFSISGVSGVGMSWTNATDCRMQQGTIYDVAEAGIDVQSSLNMDVYNVTIWSNPVAAIQVSNCKTVDVVNCVLSASGSNASVYAISGTAPSSDYNDLLQSDGAVMGRSGSLVYKNVREWQDKTGQDVHSLTHDPLFADASAGDFHLQSSGGRSTASGKVKDAGISPLIDAGKTSFSYSTEPSPNGNRINIGAFGNTDTASRTDTNGWLVALTCNDGGTMRGTNILYWVAGGVATGQTVSLSYSADGGETWTLFATNLSANSGFYIWDTLTNGPYTSVRTHWKVTSESGITGETEKDFVINNGPIDYYVNDASLVDDVYCTAVGSDSADGLSSNTPKADISSILDTYPVRSGDRIWVDTGVYDLSRSLVLAGISGTNELTVAGSPEGSVLQCQNDITAFSISQSKGIALSHFEIQDAGTAVSCSTSTNVAMSSLTTRDCTTGLRLSSSRNVGVSHAVFAGGTYGLYQQSSQDGTTLDHAVFYSNRSYAVYAMAGSVGVTNSVFELPRSGSYAVRLDGSAAFRGDYNDYWLGEGAYAGFVYATKSLYYPTLSAWSMRSTSSGTDKHSLSENPLFADAENGDFALQSTQGRYDETNWVTDTVTSPLIDAGFGDVGDESEPNGKVPNIGTFGGTSLASHTPSAGWITPISLNDGGSVRGTITLCWAVGGAATGHLAKVEYSPLNGATDSWVTIADSVALSARGVTWNTTGYDSTPMGRWRITSKTDVQINATNRSYFAVRNQPLSFYVNDSETTGDVYCSAPGDALLSGAFADEPKDQVADIIAAYDIQSGDTIYVDTGTYALSNSIVLDRFVQGISGSPIVVQGSTNWTAGGSVLDAQGGTALTLDESSYIHLQSLIVTNASTGIVLSDVSGVNLEWMRVAASSRGMQCTGASVFMEHVQLVSPSVALQVNNGSAVTVNHALLQAKTVVDHNGGTLNLTNTLLKVNSSSGMAFDLASSSIMASDYNAFDLVSGAKLARKDLNPIDAVYPTLASWVSGSGQDDHSFVGNVDGTMSDEGWFSLPLDSVLIDAGTGSYSSEPLPNGFRANMGILGNSTRAQITQTNAAVSLISFNDGGLTTSNTVLRWVAHGVATGMSLRIEYSLDGADTWMSLTTVTGADGAYDWDTSGIDVSLLTRWRMVDDATGDVLGTSDANFAIRNAPARFYVNDTQQEGDVYTTQPGSPYYSGVTSNAPKNSVQDIFNTYDVEPGDIIYVDTGNNAYSVTIGSLDTGTVDNPVRIIGSTNEQAGGTIFTRGFTLSEANGIHLEQLHFSNVSTAVKFSNYASGSLSWVRMSGGSTAVDASGTQVSVDMDHCSVRNVSSHAIYAGGSAKMALNHCVLSGNKYGVEVNGGTVYVTNSAISVSGSGRYAYYLGTSGSIYGDYNAFDVQNGAMFGYKKSSRLPTYWDSLASWVADKGTESHSMCVDPLFADAANGDFHLQTMQSSGRYDAAGESWTNDAMSSPLIDAGTGDFSAETIPNGSKANIGMYGSSLQASRTATNGLIQLLSFDDGGRTEGTTRLSWTAQGLATGAAARIDYSSDNGENWSEVATNVAVSSGQIEWVTTDYVSSPAGRWRMQLESHPEWNVTNQAVFQVRNVDHFNFYVNDADVTDDAYCSQPGSVSNNGLSSESPMDSISRILATYDLNAGDRIYVDTGSYTDSVNWTYFDAGSSLGDVTLVGSGNGSHLYGGFSLEEAPYVTLSDMMIHPSGTAVLFDDYSDYGNVDGCRIMGGSTGVDGIQTKGIKVTHTLFDGQSLRSIYARSQGYIAVDQSVLWNAGKAIEMAGGAVTLQNSLLYANGSSKSIYYLNSGSVSSDYNALFVTNGAMVATKRVSPVDARYESVASWNAAYHMDAHSLSVDPQLVDGANGDMHLTTNSPLIDAGNPASSYENEPKPNGNRANIGLYGNTAEAIITPLGAYAQTVSYNDGGVVSGSASLYWVARNMTSVHIEYSADGGRSWTRIASSVNAAAGVLENWDTLSVDSSAAGKWRIINAASGVVSESDAFFAVRNDALFFYVNDDNTTADVYCSAAGAFTNLGVTADAPNNSLSYLFDQYDLEGGDRIYVDTGEYSLLGTVSVGYFDQGSSTSQVTVVGSTAQDAGGSRLLGGRIAVSDAQGIALKNLTLQNGNGIYYSKSDYGSVSDCIFATNSTGLKMETCRSMDVQRNVFRANNLGINANGLSGVTITHNVFDNGKGYALQGDGRSGATVQNNIYLMASNTWCYYRADSYSIDYNLYDFAGEPLLSNPSYTNLTDWQVLRHRDYRSAVTNADFVDAMAGDYHLRSRVGTYDAATGQHTNIYAEQSWAIDGGVISADYDVEPQPNGGRVNMGLYGNTAQAGLSETNCMIIPISPVAGMVVDEEQWPMTWTARHLAESNRYGMIQLSIDGGDWTNVNDAVDLWNEYWMWPVDVEMNGANNRWRILDQSTTGQVFAVTNDGNFAILLEHADVGVSLDMQPMTNAVHYLEPFSLIITVTNSGPDAPSSLSVKNVMTNHLVYLSDNSEGNFSTNNGSWSVGSVLPGGSTSLTLTVMADCTGVMWTNSVTLSSSMYDPDTNNNWAAFSNDVAVAADIQVTKSVDFSSATNKQRVTFMVGVKNAGPDDVSQLDVLDLLPAGLAFDSVVANDYDVTNGMWSVGALGAGEETLMYLSAVVTNAGILLNTASVYSAGGVYDQNPSNNVATAAVNVDVTPEIRLQGINHAWITNGSTRTTTANGTEFGSVEILRDSVQHTFVVTNPGSGALTLTDVVSDNPAIFEVLDYPTTVVSEGSDSLTIRFSPVQSGAQVAVISIMNDAVSNYTFSVSGSGLLVPQLTLSGTNGEAMVNGRAADVEIGTDCGAINVADGAVVRELTLSNPGTGPLSVSGVTVHGSSAFALSPSAMTVATGATSTLTLAFDPSSAGVHTAMVAVANNSSLSPFTFAVRGTGTVQGVLGLKGMDGSPITNGMAVASRFSGTDFGTVEVFTRVTNVLHLINSGNGSLAFSPPEMTGSGAPDFAASTAGSTLAAGATNDFVLTFSPTNGGARSAVITLRSDGTEDLFSFTIYGIGGSSPNILMLGTNHQIIAGGATAIQSANGTDFGALDILASAQHRSFGMTNNGSASLTVSNVTISGDSAFELVSYPGQVAVDARSNVVIRFDPTVVGKASAVISITSDGGISPYTFTVGGTGTAYSALAVLGSNLQLIPNGSTNVSTASGTDFGSVLVYHQTLQHTFYVTNSGSATLSITSSVVEGGAGSDFAVRDIPSQVAPQTRQAFDVQFDPSASGDRSAKVWLYHDGTNGSYAYSIGGEGSLTNLLDIRIESFMQTNHAVAVGWQGPTGPVYSIHFATDLTESSWTQSLDSASITTNASPVATDIYQFYGSDLITQTQRFYRIEVER
ncbi:MAG: choice-of-anchor D domain-containing protein [Spartobacteria bacterium]|nr:choice-of-anchor D domain-containing protein [Spartobacteria bacterium]